MHTFENFRKYLYNFKLWSFFGPNIMEKGLSMLLKILSKHKIERLLNFLEFHLLIFHIYIMKISLFRSKDEGTVFLPCYLCIYLTNILSYCQRGIDEFCKTVKQAVVGA